MLISNQPFQNPSLVCCLLPETQYFHTDLEQKFTQLYFYVSYSLQVYDLAIFEDWILTGSLICPWMAVSQFIICTCIHITYLLQISLWKPNSSDLSRPISGSGFLTIFANRFLFNRKAYNLYSFDRSVIYQSCELNL